MAEMVYGVMKEVTKLGCYMIVEEWEVYAYLISTVSLYYHKVGLC